MKKTEVTDAASLGRALRDARVKAGLSIAEVAQKMKPNASPSHLSSVELGRLLPSLRTLSRIGDVLGLRWKISLVEGRK